VQIENFNPMNILQVFFTALTVMGVAIVIAVPAILIAREQWKRKF
jgi:Na+-transporting methylmalonyl-CoA/oxaloacetate decarboxylase gamma subunit